MNEFIVWDKISKRFLDDIDEWEYSRRNKDIEFYSGCDVVGGLGKDTWTIHECIGKADINDKKIYADCSIVEFEYREFFPNTSEKKVGYFTYNNEELCYMIIVEGWKPQRFFTDRYVDFKIIDTIQENELGLLKGLI